MGTGDNTAHDVSTAQGWGVVSFPPEADDKWHAAEATGAMLSAGRMDKRVPSPSMATATAGSHLLTHLPRVHLNPVKIKEKVRSNSMRFLCQRTAARSARRICSAG